MTYLCHFPPFHLFHEDNLAQESILNNLKKFLKNKIGVDFVDWPECPKSSNLFQFAATVYACDEYAEEKEFAFQIIPANRQPSPVSGSVHNEITTPAVAPNLHKCLHRNKPYTLANVESDAATVSKFDMHDAEIHIDIRPQNTKAHHDIAQRFRDEPTKFGGDVSNDIL